MLVSKYVDFYISVFAQFIHFFQIMTCVFEFVHVCGACLCGMYVCMYVMYACARACIVCMYVVCARVHVVKERIHPVK